MEEKYEKRVTFGGPVRDQKKPEFEKKGMKNGRPRKV